MVIKYTYQHLPFKGPPKFTQIWDFWFENKPSGNPDKNRVHRWKMERNIFLLDDFRKLNVSKVTCVRLVSRFHIFYGPHYNDRVARGQFLKQCSRLRGELVPTRQVCAYTTVIAMLYFAPNPSWRLLEFIKLASDGLFSNQKSQYGQVF
jgi:hypothetical protein